MRQQYLVLFAAMAALAAGSAQADVFNMPAGQTSVQFVTVGNPGNAADTNTGGYFDSVPYTYQMGKYDVTVGQYVQFLNAVAQTDTYGLYNGYMAPTPGNPISTNSLPTIGIAQSGSSGSYSYSVAGSYAQAANCPMADVTWGDAARFCNWLQNGQPTGAEGPGTTETGAYTLNGATFNLSFAAITRNAGATYFLPTEQEWYKAAYFDPSLNSGTGGYWSYPTKSNTPPGNTLPDTGNNANYNNNGVYTDPTNYLTPVGAFAASPSPYGAFDMGGDLWQWTEATLGLSREVRGGLWDAGVATLASSYVTYGVPANEYNIIGFRVASVPEPGSIMLVVAGGLCLLAYARRRRTT